MKGDIIFDEKLSKLQNIKKIIVTQGKNGATLYDNNQNETLRCPAFTAKKDKLVQVMQC